MVVAFLLYGLLQGVLAAFTRSEEHTSELQSQFHLVCRLVLEKKNMWQMVLGSRPGATNLRWSPVASLVPLRTFMLLSLSTSRVRARRACAASRWGRCVGPSGC